MLYPRKFNYEKLGTTKLGFRNMLYLYHASPSVAPVLVRIVLQEKGLPWDGKILDLLRGDQFQPEYRKLKPESSCANARSRWAYNQRGH